jgi:hypothetical protein
VCTLIDALVCYGLIFIFVSYLCQKLFLVQLLCGHTLLKISRLQGIRLCSISLMTDYRSGSNSVGHFLEYFGVTQFKKVLQLVEFLQVFGSAAVKHYILRTPNIELRHSDGSGH